MKKLTIALAGITIIAGLSSCASPTISYTDSGAVDTTSMDFSSTDLQTTTNKMLDSMFSSPRIQRLTTNSSNEPVLYFSGIKNNTSQHINTQMLENTVSTRLINSGEFQVADMNQINKIKEQMDFQNTSGMIDKSTAVKMGKQIGANFVMYGDISNISARNDSQESQFFLITLKMLDIEKGVIIWQGEKQIRKVQKKSTWGW